MEPYRNEYILKDGQKLIVRTPEEGDAQGLINLMQTVDNETKFLSREPGEFNITLENEIDFIRNKNNEENGRFLIAELDGNIIGNCYVGIEVNNKRYLHRAGMAIVVRKDCWNKGIGKKMMQECINWCNQKGIEQLELEVVTQNERAITMYKSFGFDIYGTKKHALKYADGTYADEYFMCLFLNGMKPE
ncbi:GNAT family N-acetyltransferase [Mobilitalea sibirica]|uniref:GNAT family N-acetyltransferase n=1 Tax=Mobilitalea sibirica TaxID=1462919 RepID=A0A8J7KT20_9FIRM|nr:GNAT family N-acetyltransferase [Mobilitalea sibirica]MBH1940896.1 GNAT family N-acetyltransferase [Mobilitalea sibirica]